LRNDIKTLEEVTVTKSQKHYLPNGKEYVGPTHKMGGELHTGASHTSASKRLSHSAPKVMKKKK